MYKRTIEQIPKNFDYEGYLWLSDQKMPAIDSLNEILKNIFDSSNPFIVEGQLYSKNENKSYSIKYADGKHHVTEYDLNAATSKSEIKTYLSNIEGVSKLNFRQYWELKSDELCEGMNVLMPTAFVFIGFEYNGGRGQ